MKCQMTGNSRMCVVALLAICLVLCMVQIGLATHYDFNGETVRVYTMGRGAFFSEGPNYAWLQEVEEMFNVKIEFNSTGAGNFISSVVTGMIAGDPPGDIFWTRHGITMQLAQQGMLQPLHGIINDEYYQRIPEIYRNRHFYEQVGTPYAFSSNDDFAHQGIPFHNPVGIAWNKDMFAELGLPDLYELQESGDWTYQALIDIAIQATQDTTGDGEIDQWGVAGYSGGIHWHQLLSTVASNNVDWVVMKDGKYTVNVTDPAFLDALQLWQDLRILHNASGSINGRALFAEGSLAMLVSCMAGLTTARNSGMEQEWGWVYYPKGPNAEDYAAFVHMFHVASLPLGVENPEALVELASALFRSMDPYMAQPLDEYLESGLDKLALDGFITDRESYETFRRMYSDMRLLPFFRDFFVHQDGVQEAVTGIRDGEVFALPAFAALQPALQAALDEYLGQ